MKTLASNPGAGTFRSILVITLILVFISLFFTYTNKLNHEVEVVAKNRVLTDMRLSLSMMLYDFTIKGQISDLKKFDLGNPFLPLGMYRSLPQNYRGIVTDKNEIEVNGWYFDSTIRRAIYRFNDRDFPDEEFVMQWKFEDLNNNGVQDRNEIAYLKLEKV